MAAEQGTDTVGGPQIRIGDYIYQRVSNSLVSRQHRSHVSLYTGEDIKDMEEYKYTRLHYMRRRIRLLRLHGGGLSNPEITCELFEVAYDKDHQNVVRSDDGTRIEYEALSWCWGREERDRAIRIRQGGDDYRLAVTKELSLALKYLRHRHGNRILWIDAICIDQQNHEERNHQVQMMARIYNGARQACIWLGEDDNDSTKAIAFIHEIMKLENFDTVSEKSENASKWQSLLLLMQRSWFSRRWVVQEVALARTATIYCGTDNIPWEHFAVAVELFVEVETATHRLSEVMRKDERFGHVPQWFEHVSELGASILVEATGKVFRRDGTNRVPVEESNRSDVTRGPEVTRGHQLSRSKSKKPSETQTSADSSTSSDWSLQRPLLSLEYLVSSLTVFEAAQPRDAVYSLLAISRDTAPFAEMLTVSQDGSEEAIIMSTVSSFLERKPFKVDYSRPFSDICKDFIDFCIRVSGKSDPSRALDILCRPWAPEPEVSHASVVHKKPTPYKFHSKGREKLWHPRTDGRPHFRVLAEYHPSDIVLQHDLPAQRVGAPMLRQHDPRSTSEYMADARKDWEENWKKRKESFDRDVKPYLPRKPRRPSRDRATRDRHDSTTNTPRDAGADEDAGDDNDDGDDTVEDMELPSWVSRISGASFALFRLPGMNEGTRIGRQNADSLVGAPQDGYKTYSAAQNTKIDYKTLSFRKRPGKREYPGNGHYSLFIEGFVLAKVEATAEPARLGAIPTTWTELAGWEGAMDGKTEPPAEFWRTLVADRGKDHRNPPYYYATACRESVRKGGFRGGSVDTGALISKERNSIIAEFCRRVQAVIWNRCLIKTAIETGDHPKALGLASEKVKKGDLVCIFSGCTVPVILRECSRPKTESDLRAEQMQDRIESMKEAVAMCEEACFRKNRYKKKLAKERAIDPMEEEFWRKEVKEELDVVNQQMKEWSSEGIKAREKRLHDDEKQKKRNNEAETRLKRRRKWLEQRQNTASLNHQKNRSLTMPTFLTAKTASDANGLVPNSRIAGGEESHPHSSDQGQGIAQGSTNRGRDRERDPAANETFPEISEDEIQKRKDEAKKEARKQAKEKDPYLFYKFIGESYIHGMMDGEAVRLHFNEGIPRRTFEIR